MKRSADENIYQNIHVYLSSCIFSFCWKVIFIDSLFIGEKQFEFLKFVIRDVFTTRCFIKIFVI